MPDIGYLHRSIEKIAEKVGWHGFLPYTDRVDYVAAMFANECWATACEKLMNIEVPEQYGGLKVLAQAKGIGPGSELLGFANRES